LADDSAIIGRMIFKLEKTLPTPDSINRALLKISMWIIAKAKMNVRRKRIIDRGHLINSLSWELYRTGKTYGSFIGSFGVKYAAMNEFGGPVSRKQMRAIFASMQRRTIHLPSKGVITRRGAGYWWRERPYLRPAVIESKNYIMETLRKEL